MKTKLIILFSFFSLFFFNISADDVPLFEDVIPKGRSLSILPLTAELSNQILTIEFKYIFETAAISITNASGDIEFQTNQATIYNNRILIPIEFLSTGIYKLNVQIGVNTYFAYLDVN